MYIQYVLVTLSLFLTIATPVTMTPPVTPVSTIGNSKLVVISTVATIVIFLILASAFTVLLIATLFV